MFKEGVSYGSPVITHSPAPPLQNGFTLFQTELQNQNESNSVPLARQKRTGRDLPTHIQMYEQTSIFEQIIKLQKEK